MSNDKLNIGTIENGMPLNLYKVNPTNIVLIKKIQLLNKIVIVQLRKRAVRLMWYANIKHTSRLRISIT